MIEVSRGHSFEVDWWSLGIVTHEMMIGHTPFMSSASEYITEKENKKRILHQNPRFNKIAKFSRHNEIQAFITDLLIKQPQHRLGL